MIKLVLSAQEVFLLRFNILKEVEMNFQVVILWDAFKNYWSNLLFDILIPSSL